MKGCLKGNLFQISDFPVLSLRIIRGSRMKRGGARIGTYIRKSQWQQQGSHTDNEVTSLSTLSSAECRLQATLAPLRGGFGNGRRNTLSYYIQIGIGIVNATVG